MRACLIGLVAALGLGSSAGCGLTLDLEPEPDGGSGADLGLPPDRDAGSQADLGPPDRCERAEEGRTCALGESLGVCIDGSCVPARCGDGFVTGAELCDDGNNTDGDGCQADCLPGCEDDDECPSSECSAGRCVAGRCEATLMADGERCTGGVCRGGSCVAAECGDGFVNDDELCDDANDMNGDGCDNDCTPSCSADSDCDDGIDCNGTERCVDGTTEGSALCAAAEFLPTPDRACEYCDSTTGRFELIDEDGDGFTPVPGDGCEPLDCNDADPTIYPGAPMTTSGIDSNCDGVPDDPMGVMICYADGDGDGFGDPTNPTSADTMGCGADLVPAGRPDCNDANGDVNPGQLDYFAEPYDTTDGSSFDYDCDGREERLSTTRVSPCGGLMPAECDVSAPGWLGPGVPECGEEGMVGFCQWMGSVCTTVVLPGLVTQRCR